MTGIKLALVTHSQPELPTSRPAEERDQTRPWTSIICPLRMLLTYAQLLERLLLGAVFGREPEHPPRGGGSRLTSEPARLSARGSRIPRLPGTI